MSLASRSANPEHIATQLQAEVVGLSPEVGDTLTHQLAKIVSDLDHKLRVEVDEAIGRLEARIEEELRELAEAEQ